MPRNTTINNGRKRHSPGWKYEVVRESMVGTVYRCPRCGEVDTWLILRESGWCIPLEYQIGMRR